MTQIYAISNPYHIAPTQQLVEYESDDLLIRFEETRLVGYKDRDLKRIDGGFYVIHLNQGDFKSKWEGDEICYALVEGLAPSENQESEVRMRMFKDIFPVAMIELVQLVKIETSSELS
ncbi:hypothetical protein GAQ89_001699 [Escherichia coli]|nr:hypothetical protein [Escherichia coli]